MSTRVNDGAVRPRRKSGDEGSSDKLAKPGSVRKKAELEAEARGTQSPVRLLFAFLIPVLLLIAYAVFGG